MKDKIIEIIHKYRPGWLDPSIAAQEIEDAIDENQNMPEYKFIGKSLKDKIIEILKRNTHNHTLTMSMGYVAQEIEDAIDENEIAKRVIEEYIEDKDWEPIKEVTRDTLDMDSGDLFDWLDRRE